MVMTKKEKIEAQLASIERRLEQAGFEKEKPRRPWEESGNARLKTIRFGDREAGKASINVLRDGQCFCVVLNYLSLSKSSSKTFYPEPGFDELLSQPFGSTTLGVFLGVPAVEPV